MVLAIEACLELGFKQDALEVAIVQVDALPGLGVSEIGAGVGSCSIDCSSDEGSFLLSHLGSDLLFNLSSQGGLFLLMLLGETSHFGGVISLKLSQLGLKISDLGVFGRNLTIPARSLAFECR